MHHTTKILLCLCLAIGMHGQQAPAFTDKNAQTASNIIGLVTGSATAYIIFKKMRGNSIPQKPDLEEKRETIDLSDDDIIVVDAQQFAQEHSTQNSFFKSLVASLLCGAVVGIATKVGSQWILDRCLVDELTAYVRDNQYAKPKEVFYPKNLEESKILEYLRKNNPTAHFFTTKSGVFSDRYSESYQERKDREKRWQQKQQEEQERKEREERERKEQEEREERERKEQEEREERERKEQEKKQRKEQEKKQRKKHENQQKYWYEYWEKLFSHNDDDDNDQKYLKALGFTDGENPTNDDIRLRYKKLVMEKHPDRGGSKEEFQRIHEAYEKLKPPPQKPGTTSETN